MQDACVDVVSLALSLSISWVCFAHCTCDFSHVFYLLFAILLSFAGCCSVHTHVCISSHVCTYVCVIVNGHRAA